MTLPKHLTCVKCLGVPFICFRFL